MFKRYLIFFMILSIKIYSNNLIEKEIDYNPDEEILFVYNYIFDKTGLLTNIEFRSMNNVYQGERKFIYNDKKITEEQLLDDKKKMILKKKYVYVNNII